MPSRVITRKLASEFEKHVARAESVRIASAWMTESDAFESLLRQRQRGCDVKAIIGVRGNATSPTSLRRLADAFGWESLSISDPPGLLFHPKLYLFAGSVGRNVAWIGSANFTCSGMAVNTELMLESDDDRAFAAMLDWFDRQWDALRAQNTQSVLAGYERDWEEPHSYVGDRGGLSPRTSRERVPVVPPTSSAAPSHADGKRTPPSAFREPIRQALEEMGGQGTREDVLERVEKIMEHRLEPIDYEEYRDRGLKNWQQNADNERRKMADDGLIRRPSTPGEWELVPVRKFLTN